MFDKKEDKLLKSTETVIIPKSTIVQLVEQYIKLEKAKKKQSANIMILDYNSRAVSEKNGAKTFDSNWDGIEVKWENTL